jgi:hypothetical protein
LRTKEGNSFKSSIFRVEVVIPAKHISSAPTGESSSTMELQIGGAATPEWVWWVCKVCFSVDTAVQRAVCYRTCLGQVRRAIWACATL